MTAFANQIFETAMALGDDDRIQLAERLLGSLRDDPEVLAKQLEVVKRRAAEIESGAVEAIPRDEAFRRVREALAEKRSGA